MDERRDGDGGGGDGGDGGDEAPPAGAGDSPADPVPPGLDRPDVPGPPQLPAWGAAPGGPAQPTDYWVRSPSGPAVPLAPPSGTLRVLSVVGRSIDLFLQRPRPFLLLALPSAIVSILTSFLYLVAGGQQLPAPGTVPTMSVAASLALVMGFVAVIVAIALSLAMTMAADDVRAGRTVDVRGRLGQGVRRTGIAILSAIAEFLAVLGLVLGGAIVVGLVAVTRLLPLAIVGGIALFVLLAWVLLRWALSAVSIALEPVGPLEALGRSRAVTRGNVWRMVAVYLIFGLITLPLSFGIGLLSVALSDIAVPVVIFAAVVSLATVPLFGILPTMIFGDLTGRPEAPRRPVNAQLRLGYLGGLVIVGVVALAVAIPRMPGAFERIVEQAAPARNRGVILASPVRNPLDPCQPIPFNGPLLSSEPIYIGGYFTKLIPAGQTATVEVYIDGQLANTARIGNAAQASRCWYEPDPLVDAEAATWRIVVRLGGEVIAEGAFTIR